MKSFQNLPLLFLFFSTIIFGQKTSQQILNQLKNPKPNSVLVVAHRSDWRNAPENSIDAMKRAIEMGVDIIELDVRKTKDGKLIVMHDFTLDRTSNGKGLISETMYDSIAKLFLKDGIGIVRTNKIPTLAEAMLFVKDKPVLVNLDKAYDCIPETYKVLVETGTVDQGLFKGSETVEVLNERYPEIMPKIHYMPMVWDITHTDKRKISNEPIPYTQNFLKKSNPIAFEVIFDNQKPPVFELIKSIRDAKKTVWINTLWDSICAGYTDEKALENPDANWGEMIKWGANVIQTDRPKELIDYLSKRKMH
jgi:glycerophosphoryl diester phosphodiesterase